MDSPGNHKKEEKEMRFTRREFLKTIGTSAACGALLGLGFDLKPFQAHAQTLKIQFSRETTSICCYCAVGCGIIQHGRGGRGKNRKH